MRLLVRSAAAVPAVVAALAAAPAAAGPVSVAVRCTAGAVAVKWNARGQVQVLEYRALEKDPLHPVATGRILAYADTTTRTVNPVCHAARPTVPRPRDYDSASFDTHVPETFFCDQHNRRNSAFLIQVSAVRARGAAVGSRLLVQDAAHPRAAALVDATLRARGSRFVVRVQECFRLYGLP